MAPLWGFAAAVLVVILAVHSSKAQFLTSWEDENCFALAGTSQDCRFEGAFACSGVFPNHPPNAVVGQGVTGYCHRPVGNRINRLSHNSTTNSISPSSLIQGALDNVTPNLDGSVHLQGWAVDHGSPGNGRTAVDVGMYVDSKLVFITRANVSRPPLVSAGVAPDPDHGIDATVPANVAGNAGIAFGSHGNHTVTLQAWRWNDTSRTGLSLPVGKPKCIASGRELESCGGDPVPVPWYCCRLRQPGAVSPPAPPRGKTYPHPPTERPPHGQASVVLVITDDQDVMLGSLRAMNSTRALLQDGGATFDRFFTTTPVCCPSRISLLTGRWAHNTGAVATTPAGWCALGKFYKGPGQQHALPTYIQKAGIATGIFGKEINANDATTISPGWDRFFVLGGQSEGHYYADWFSDQGQRYQAGPDEYMTDLIQDRALKFITEQIKANKHFFAYIAPHAPHTRATPPTWASGYFADDVAPRTPSWNVSMPNHHWVIRTQPPMTDLCASYSDQLYRNRLQALIGVDAMVEKVADTLLEAGRLDSTYFLYTSDHGFHLGEMRVPFFKVQPYDTDIRIPFMIRGPGIKPGTHVADIGLNVDIAPTIAELLGTTPPTEAAVDGHSLLPLIFKDESTEESAQPWRNDFVFEFWEGGKVSNAVPGSYCHHFMTATNNTYQGVRTVDGLKYVSFADAIYSNGNGEQIEEAFNTTADPWEMHNLIHDQQAQSWISRLRARLAVLRNCSMSECW